MSIKYGDYFLVTDAGAKAVIRKVPWEEAHKANPEEFCSPNPYYTQHALVVWAEEDFYLKAGEYEGWNDYAALHVWKHIDPQDLELYILANV